MSINFNSASSCFAFSEQSPVTSFSLEELRKKIPAKSLSLVDQYFEATMSKNISDQRDVIDKFVYHIFKASINELDLGLLVPALNHPEPDLNHLESDLKGFVEAFGLVNTFILFGRCFLLASQAEREQGEKFSTRVKILSKILMFLTSNKSHPDYLELEQARFDLEKLKFVKEKISPSFVAEGAKFFNDQEKLTATLASNKPKKSTMKSKLINLIGLGVVLILAKKFLEVPKMDQLKKALSSYPPNAVPIVESCMESGSVGCQGIFATAYTHLLGSESDYLAHQLAGKCLERSNCKHDAFAEHAYLSAVELGSRGMRENTKDKLSLYHASYYAETCLDQLDRPVCKFIVDRAFSDFLVSPYTINRLVKGSIKINDEYLMSKVEESYPRFLEKYSELARNATKAFCAKKQSPICETSAESSSSQV